MTTVTTRRPVHIAVVLAVCLGGVLHPMATAGAEEAPMVLYALGGPAALPQDVLEDIAAETGQHPERLAGSERYGTAAAISRHAFPDGAATVYLTTGRGTADALAAAAALDAHGAALLPVERDAVPSVVAEELQRLGPAHVFALGGRAALSDEVLASVQQLTGIQPTRIGGDDRFTTAASISRHALPDGAATVYLASGRSPADALAASAAVAVHDGGFLLTEPDHLPAATARELVRLAPDRVIVLGGPAAVSAAVLDEIEEATGMTATRLAGADRVRTAAAIAAHAYPDGARTIYLANSRRMTDALAASAAAVASGGVLRLVDVPEPTTWIPRLDEAAAYAQSRSGSVSFAVIGTDGALVGHRAGTAVPAASVLKVMFMVAYLRQPDVAERALTDSDRALLEPMIRRSANEPATRIANLLGPGPMERLARDAGMRDFAYTRPWGLSRTSARDQVRFMLDFERHLPSRHREEALRLLTEIVPEQRWGIGEVATPGWVQHFKGGWGSGSGAVDHQVVLLRHTDGTTVALAVMTTGNRDHADGTATLRGTFQRLLADLP